MTCWPQYEFMWWWQTFMFSDWTKWHVSSNMKSCDLDKPSCLATGPNDMQLRSYFHTRKCVYTQTFIEHSCSGVERTPRQTCRIPITPSPLAEWQPELQLRVRVDECHIYGSDWCGLPPQGRPWCSVVFLNWLNSHREHSVSARKIKIVKSWAEQ